MKTLINYLVTAIVDKPEAVLIDEKIGENDSIGYTIHVDKNDMGKLIGREGRTICAIRELVKVKAVKENKYVNIEIAE